MTEREQKPLGKTDKRDFNNGSVAIDLAMLGLSGANLRVQAAALEIHVSLALIRMASRK